MTTKTCAGWCGVAKPLTEFYLSPDEPDGHMPACKACVQHHLEIVASLAQQTPELLLKICTNCHEVKPLTAFPRQPKGLTRRNAQCSACRHEYAVSPRVRQRRRELAADPQRRAQRRAKERARLAADPEARERKNATNRASAARRRREGR